MLVGTPVSVVGSRFWYQDEISDGLVGVGRVSDIKIIIFVMRGRFTVVALLPLTQNTLPSKDVREYVFSCFLMAYRSRDLQGMILNEFGITLGSIISHNFSQNCHLEGVDRQVSRCLSGLRCRLSGVGFGIKMRYQMDWWVSEGCRISKLSFLSCVVGLRLWRFCL